MDDSPPSSTWMRLSDWCQQSGRARAPALRSGFGRSGGTGRRAGLKIRFPPGSVGSIPTFGIGRPSWSESRPVSPARSSLLALLLPEGSPSTAGPILPPVLQPVTERIAATGPVCRRLSSVRRGRPARRPAADSAHPVLLPCLDPHRPHMTAEPARKRLHRAPPSVVHRQCPSGHPGTHPGEHRSGRGRVRPSTRRRRSPDVHLRRRRLERPSVPRVGRGGEARPAPPLPPA